MKNMFLRSVYLWPRFHVNISKTLDTLGHVDLIEFRVPLTRRMKDIQAAILDCLHECIQEVKRSHPTVFLLTECIAHVLNR